MKRLQDIAEYVDERISSTEIELSDYVTIDCLLQNKNGRTIASNLPPVKCNLIKYQKNDILIANIRPYLKKIWYADRQGGASADVLVFRAKTSIDPLYLYAVFLQDSFYDYVMRATKGSKMPRGDKNHIMNYIIHPVSGAEEKRIGQIISNINTKIELNKKISRELEAMAKELYDYWFVQFEFPNEQGKPYKSSGGKMVWNETLKREIPEGWEVKKLGDIISKLSSGKRPKGGIDKTLKTGIPSLGAECINEHLGEFDFLSTPFIKDSFKDKLSNGKIEKNDILIYKDGAYVGKVTLFRDGFPYQDAYVNEHVFLIHATEEKYEEFLYFTLSSSSYFKIMQNLGKVKAAQPGLNKDDLNSIMLLVPGKDIIINFHNKVESYFRKIFLNANQLGRLVVLRNQLLPLLMNGQVRVE